MKTTPRVTRLLILPALALLASSADAHDTWLRVAKGSSSSAVALELTSGMIFPAADYAIKPERIDTRGCRTSVGSCDLKIERSGAHALHLGADGAAEVAWIDLAPKTLTLDDEKVVEYLDEIDASKAIRDLWAAMPSPRVWRETYVKHAKALISEAGDSPRKSWSVPTGSALEFVPIGAMDSHKGQSASFRLIENGKPAGDVAVGVIGSAGGKPQFLRTDAAGELRLELDHAGDWLIRVTRLLPPTSPKGNWSSHFATVSFKVAPSAE